MYIIFSLEVTYADISEYKWHAFTHFTKARSPLMSRVSTGGDHYSSENPQNLKDCSEDFEMPALFKQLISLATFLHAACNIYIID